MIIAVQGSKSFTDYQIFLRAMGTALSTINPGDTEIFIYSAGPANVNSMCMEFSNVVERSMKARGIRIKMQKAPIKWMKENVDNFNYFIYLLNDLLL